MVLTGLAHGLLAGNFMDTELAEMKIGTVLFSLNWGTLCFALSVLLGISYLVRKVLKKNWMPVHHILTVCLLAVLAIHVVDVGIQLPKRILAEKTDSDIYEEQIKEEVNHSTLFSNAQLKDGVYEGVAEGYIDTIKVSVAVEGGTVTEIEILEENDTPQFFERAKEIIDEIITNQSLNVDAVSGATYSSAGIINAVTNALEPAIVDGELEKNDTELPAEGHHRHGRPGGGKRPWHW